MSAMRIGALLCLLLVASVSTGAARTFVLTGRVLEAFTLRPISAARVYYDSGHIAYTDSSGCYVLTLTNGTPYILVEAESMYTIGSLLSPFGDSQIRNPILLRRSAPAISGRVTDRHSGSPLDRAQVKMLGGLGFVFTDSSGRFVLPIPSPGRLSIWAAKLVPSLGIVEEVKDIDVPEDGLCNVELQLERMVNPGDFGSTP